MTAPGPPVPCIAPDHWRCEQDCACRCGDPLPYEAKAGVCCRRCWGWIRKDRYGVLVTGSDAGGITISHTEWAELG